VGKTGYADAFGDAVGDIEGPTYDLAAGLLFSYPLGNRAAEARHRAALLSRRSAAEAITNLSQIVELDVRLAAAEVARASQQIAASAATRSLREEAVRAESERFRVGQSTGLLVAQAQRDLLESQIAEVQAVVAYREALIQLNLAEGTLLARRGLRLQVPEPR
jgi:outer membrane protein TolC